MSGVCVAYSYCFFTEYHISMATFRWWLSQMLALDTSDLASVVAAAKEVKERHVTILDLQ